MKEHEDFMPSKVLVALVIFQLALLAVMLILGWHTAAPIAFMGALFNMALVYQDVSRSNDYRRKWGMGTVTWYRHRSKSCS